MKPTKIRIKNSSRDKKETRVITFKNYKENTQRKVIAKQPSDQQFENIRNRIFLIK